MIKAIAAARGTRRQLFWVVLAVVVVLLVVAPVLALQQLAFVNGADGLRQLVGHSRAPKVLINTVLLGLGAVAVALGSGTVLAFSVWALPPAGRRYTSFIPILPMLIPSVAHVVAFVFLFSPDNGYVNALLRMLPVFDQLTTGPFNVYSPAGIVIYTGLHISSFVYLFVYTGLQNLGEEYVYAARVNGASPARALLTVTLPLLRPVFVYATLIVLLLSLGQFAGPLVLGRQDGLDVVTTEMYLLTRESPVNYALGSAYATPVLVVAMVLVWVQYKLTQNGERFVGRAHTALAPLPTSTLTKAVAIFCIVFFVAISAVLPLLALVFVAFSPFWSGDISFAHLTTRHVLFILNDTAVRESLVTTLWISGVSILIVLPLGMLVSMAIFFRSLLWRPLAMVLEGASNLPLAIPGALIGFGFLFAYAATPFGLYGSSYGLVIAFVTIMLPFAVRYQLATLISMGPSYVEAARVSGSKPIRTFFQIILPLARTGIAAAAAVIFVLLVQEFGVALMLRAPDANVMSVVLYDFYSTGGLYPRAAAMALLVTAITMAGVVLAVAVGGVKAFERT